MKPIEYDSSLLMDFYDENDIDFAENIQYFGTEPKSYALFDGDILVGSITISKYRNVNYLEALAINKPYRKKGYGKLLLDKVINELHAPLYALSKNDDYFFKNGFKYTNVDLISKECKICSEYLVTCFPRAMVHE